MSDRKQLRSNKMDKDEDINMIQRVVEKVLISPIFLEKLLSAVTEMVTEKLKHQVAEINACKSELVSLEERMSRIETVMDEQGQYSRLNNIRVYGVPEIPHEDTCELFINLCREKLNINIANNEIDLCHRLAGREGTARPIIVRLCSRNLKNKIFYQKKKFKGTRILMTEDLTRVRIERFKNLVKYFSNKNVFTSNGVICVKHNGKILRIKTLDNYVNLINDFQKCSGSTSCVNTLTQI